MAGRLTTRFVLDRETKGALRYQEVDNNGKALAGDADGAMISTLYLRKASLEGAKPTGFTLTLDCDAKDETPQLRVAG